MFPHMKQCVHNWWKKYIILNVVSVKTYYSLVIQFSRCDISIRASVVFNFLWYRILGAQNGDDS